MIRSSVLRLSISTLLLCSITLQALAQEVTLDERVGAALAAWNNTETPGAAVAYIENGAIEFSKAFGLASLEHHVAWTTDTVSDLGSVSKQFIGFAFALLEEQGELSLDDDIRDYLPRLPDFGEVITIRHLFHHTSGLREIYNTLYLVNRKPGDAIFQEDAQKLVSYQERLQFTPGSRYLYNNTEYMLLADILEAITGQQYHDWMTENIFVPLAMHDTQIMHRQGQVIPRVATSYIRESDGQFVQRYDNSTLQGGGGIYSTVEDMVKWIANLSSLQVGTTRTINTMTESGFLNNGEPLNYGLGIAVEKIGAATVWSHSGSSAGYRSFLAYLPEHKRGYIFVTNSPANGLPADALSEVFLGDVLTFSESENSNHVAEKDDPIPLENPSDYTGRYLSDELETFYSVVMNGDELMLSHRWLGTYPMSYRGDDQFDLDGLGGPIVFIRNGDNEIVEFVLDNGRTIGVGFRRFD